jgi:hypothetical protein
MVIGDQPDMVPGEVIVKLETQPAFQALNASVRPDGIVATGLDNIDRLNQQFGVTEFDPLIKPVAQASGETLLSMAARQPALLGLYVAGFDSATDPVAVAAAYDAEPGVIYAEPNYYVYASGKLVEPLTFRPNDPYFNLQWNMAAIQAPQAWDISGGQGVLVAVLDSGIAYEDFDGYQQAPDLSSTSFVPGYDFLNNDSHANDDGGHGTHVAGTIAQSTDNGVGVAGVAFGATLMPIKVLDSRGQGSFDALAQGIMYAADQSTRLLMMVCWPSARWSLSKTGPGTATSARRLMWSLPVATPLLTGMAMATPTGSFSRPSRETTRPTSLCITWRAPLWQRLTCLGWPLCCSL